jgi:hypothetical protein
VQEAITPVGARAKLGWLIDSIIDFFTKKPKNPPQFQKVTPPLIFAQQK